MMLTAREKTTAVDSLPRCKSLIYSRVSESIESKNENARADRGQSKSQCLMSMKHYGLLSGWIPRPDHADFHGHWDPRTDCYRLDVQRS